MKRIKVISATPQGLLFQEKGRPVFKRYENTYQHKVKQKSNYNKKVQNTIDSIELNLVQREMYRRLIYGLKDFTPEQVETMSPRTKYQLIVDFSKAQKVLNVMKAKKLYQAETKLFNAMLPIKTGDRDSDWLLEIPKQYTLKKLGISVRDIINEFIDKNLLPKNFFELKLEPSF